MSQAQLKQRQYPGQPHKSGEYLDESGVDQSRRIRYVRAESVHPLISDNGVARKSRQQTYCSPKCRARGHYSSWREFPMGIGPEEKHYVPVINSMIPMQEVPCCPLAEAGHQCAVGRIKLAGLRSREHLVETLPCEINQPRKVRFLNFFK